MKFTLALSFLGISIVAFADAKPIPGLQYSADKIVFDKKSNTVELLGNAKIILSTKTVVGRRIILNLNTGVAEVNGVARYTADRMTVDLKRDSE